MSEVELVGEERQGAAEDVQDIASSGDGAAERGRAAPRRPKRAAVEGQTVASKLPKIAVEVVWGNITLVDGDVYAVGHYENVPPQNAELALDRAISGPDRSLEGCVLTSLTRRGILRGALGNVELFPWVGHDGKTRMVAVAGMGHPGSFGVPELRRVARNLTWAVSVLPGSDTLCSVLIGAGAGNLSVTEAVTGFLLGMVDALGPDLSERRVGRLRLVERELGKARLIHQQLVSLCAMRVIKEKVQIDLDAIDLESGKDGIVGDDYCMALTLAAAAVSQKKEGEQRAALETLLGVVGHPKDFPVKALKAFDRLGVKGGTAAAPDVAEIAAKLSVAFGPREASATIPTRISIVRDGPSIRAAALTETAVTPERVVGIDAPLLDELIVRMTEPLPNRVSDLSSLLARLVIPRDFRELLPRASTIVFEVDRSMARVHWEMLSDGSNGDDSIPIALKAEVARQLRTSYSPPPSAELAPRWPLRALVIGDPGDPNEGAALPAARREALEIASLFEKKGLEVKLMIGAPSVPREGELQGVPFAKRLDVLDELMRGGYDLLHFAGHGDFDADDPEKSGWLFAGGLLTSSQLELVDMAPSLVFANACLSSVLAQDSQKLVSRRARAEVELLPGLADEFFRRGVRNYVGTAWRVNDEGAVQFAREFYNALIVPPGAAGGGRLTIGAALKQARETLKRDEASYGTLWAAYQHYGDPQYRLAIPDAVAGQG